MRPEKWLRPEGSGEPEKDLKQGSTVVRLLGKGGGWVGEGRAGGQEMG